MSKLDLQSNVRLSGVWTAAGSEIENIAGEFSFDSETGGRLRLQSVDPKLAFHLPSFRVVTGMCGNTAVTLLGCQGRSFTIGTRPTEIIFGVDRAVIGAPTVDQGDVLCKTAYAQFWLLDEWVGAEGFEVNCDLQERTWSARGKQHKPIPLVEVDGHTFSIVFEMNGPQVGRRLRRLEVQQRALLRIAADTPLTLDDALRSVKAFGDFLMLQLRAPTYPTVVAIVPAGQENGEASVLFQPKFYGERAVPRNREQMLFTRDRVENVGVLLGHWLEFVKDNSSIVDRFTANLVNPSMFLECRFLNVVQALEHYHERVFSTKQSPSADFQKTLERICATCDDADAKWLRENLAYPNRKALSKKVKELVTATANSSTCYFPTKKFVKKIANQVAEVRNRISHGIAYDNLNVNLADLVMRCTRLLEILLLQRSGLSNLEIERAINQQVWREVWNKEGLPAHGCPLSPEYGSFEWRTMGAKPTS